ncbi:MAG: hypothetical protein PHD76_01600, partial [Methylacidiphilales bacterium]|nr:hypothetical protein [Candidatus Methylacidiphilales bacterium]
GRPFDWHHYGGPLAMFRFCRFVRTQILGDQPSPRKVVPIPKRIIYQQGNMVITKLAQLSPDAVPLEIETLPDGGIPLGGGHILHPGGKTGKDDL